MFRFDYSVAFLRWALQPPGQPAEWLLGVRGGKKQRLFGFISGIPVHMKLNQPEIANYIKILLKGTNKDQIIFKIITVSANANQIKYLMLTNMELIKTNINQK